MTENPPVEKLIHVHGKVHKDTQKALKIKQSQINIDTGTRPPLTEVVAHILNVWAKGQAA